MPINVGRPYPVPLAALPRERETRLGDVPLSFYNRNMTSRSSSGLIAHPARSHLFLDFDSFFASAEQHFNPALRGQAVGVVPLDVPGTGCIAVSKEAKAAGVRSNIPISEARRIRPDMVFVVARPDAYVRLHHRLLKAIESCVPIRAVRSIDELVCELVPSEADDVDELARRIKRTLRSEFSAGLTCSIGIAQSELQAKIAADLHKPDGFTILDPDEFPGILAHLRLEDIPGISKGMAARLRRAGLSDFRSLWEMEAKHCRAVWGSIEGERFWNALHGYPFERPETIKRMFGHSRMLPSDWRSPDRVGACARQLMLGAARRMRRHGGHATRMTVSVRGGGYRAPAGGIKDSHRWSAEAGFAPLRDDHGLMQQLRELLSRYDAECGFAPRSIAVMLHGIEKERRAQLDLFSRADAEASLRRERAEKLSDTLDVLRSKFGPNAATFGRHDPVPGGYLGAKIAFGRIPRLEDFGEAATRDEDTKYVSCLG